MKFKPFDSLTGVVLAVVAMIALASTTADASQTASGQAAADFTLKSRAGDNRRLSEEVGNIVIINFWASWCGPCREELPAFEEIYQEYADLGFTILGVNVDDDSSKADILLNDIDVSFPVLYDPDGKVSALYDVSAMPTTVLIDRNGKTRLVHKGYKSGDEKSYEKAIKRLLRE